MENRAQRIGEGKNEHRTLNIEHPTSNGEKNGGRGSREAAMELQETNLLLEEVETLLLERLIGIYFLRKKAEEKPLDEENLATILEIVVRLLRDRKICSIKEAASSPMWRNR